MRKPSRSWQESRRSVANNTPPESELCGALGEGRYEPDFDPAHFQTDFMNPVNPNPYFPLRVGSTWRFEGGGETIMVTVKNETKSIEGVPCIVVNDRVLEGGLLVEDTDDWFGLRHDRTVDYCGEISRNFEFPPGRQPRAAGARRRRRVVEGRSRRRSSGHAVHGDTGAGAVYRQEFSAGNAEDAAEVRSTTYGFGGDAQLDQFVPQALVELLCNNDCVVIREFTPIEPRSIGYKLYARGIGLFLEVNPRSGKVVRLVDCNVDAKCGDVRALPAP